MFSNTSFLCDLSFSQILSQCQSFVVCRAELLSACSFTWLFQALVGKFRYFGGIACFFVAEIDLFGGHMHSSCPLSLFYGPWDVWELGSF